MSQPWLQGFTFFTKLAKLLQVFCGLVVAYATIVHRAINSSSIGNARIFFSNLPHLPIIDNLFLYLLRPSACSVSNRSCHSRHIPRRHRCQRVHYLIWLERRHWPETADQKVRQLVREGKNGWFQDRGTGSWSVNAPAHRAWQQRLWSRLDAR